ncbi:MAG TPA: M48 family metalloprotease [Firmicutes bacterium]|nr:M48 family metalloprotease [Bacillota bacterium]
MIKKSLLALSLIVCILLPVGEVKATDQPRIALISVNNYSGVEKLAGTNLTTQIEASFVEKLSKKRVIKVLDYAETKKCLEKKGLGLYYETQNLCTNNDLTRIGELTGLPFLAVLEINGYNEVKKEGAKKSYEVLLGLKVYDCIEGTTHFFTGEGFSEKRRTEAFDHAVTLLINNYLDLKEEDPNIGQTRTANVEVIGNKESYMYHLKDCHHLPKIEIQVDFTTRIEAEESAYKPCPVCFPPYSSFYYYDRNIEETLGIEACGMLEYNYRLSHDPEVLNRIEKVAAPIIANTGRKNFEYKFRLLDTDEVNAFAAPNGYIYVTKGLLKIIESDDELAFVLAHEIGHLEKKHAVIRYKRALGLSIFTSILIIGSQQSDDSKADAAALFASVMAAIINQGYSREQEKEADEVAFTHLKRIGMDYQVYRVLLGKFLDMRERKIYFIEKLFATHPSPEQRREHLDKYDQAYKELQSLLAS